MNGQGSDNKRELELRSAGIITVINSSSRGTASAGSITQRCRGREMGEEGWPAAEKGLGLTGACDGKKSLVLPVPEAPPHKHAAVTPSPQTRCSGTSLCAVRKWLCALLGQPLRAVSPLFPLDPQEQRTPCVLQD